MRIRSRVAVDIPTLKMNSLHDGESQEEDWQENAELERWEMAQPVLHFLCKHEALSCNLQHPVKSRSVILACDPIVGAGRELGKGGGRDRRISWSASPWAADSVRDRVSKDKVESQRRRYSGSHVYMAYAPEHVCTTHAHHTQREIEKLKFMSD